MTSNKPTAADFIAEKIGHRDWYTAPRPRPATTRYRAYIKPSAFKAIKAEYIALFGGEFA